MTALKCLLNNFYIMYKDGAFILTNTQTHDSYELTAEKMAILADENKAVLDEDFVEAGIVGTCVEAKMQQQADDWPFPPITRFLTESLSINKSELQVFSGLQFWENYLGVCSQILEQEHEYVLPDYIKIIDLPVANEIDGKFYDLLKQRRTVREFYTQPMSLQQLADVLFTTFGRFHEGFGDKYMDVGKTISWRRSSPSAGGLHPIDAYIFVHNVSGLESGLYFYDCHEHKLRMLKHGNWEKQLLEVFMGQYFYQNAAVHIITVGNLHKVAAKYLHSRGFLFPYIENGHLLQTAWLSAVSLGLKCWMTCAFCDEFLRAELNLKKYMLPISVMSIGYGCDESLGPRIHKELEEIGYARDFVASMAMASTCKERVRTK